MKKLMFCLVVLSTGLVGCEVDLPVGGGSSPITVYDFVVKNATGSDMSIITKNISEIDAGNEYAGRWHLRNVTLEPGEEEVVYADYYGGFQTDMFEPYEIMRDYMNIEVSMTINGQTMPNEIWRRSHWEYRQEALQLVVYTLTLTDELLAELSAQE